MGTGDVKTADRTAGSSGARARGATTKILFRQEGEYRDRYDCTGKGGGGGGGRQRYGHRKNRRGESSAEEGTLARATPADASRDSRPSRGAPSPSPLHPYPSQEPPAAQVGGGCKPAYGKMDRTTGEDIGRLSARGLVTSDGRTTGEQTLLEWDGRLHRNGQRGGNRKKGERIRARCYGGQGTRVNLGGGDKEGPEPSLTGNIVT